MFSIRWRTRGRVVSWPDRPNGVLSYPAPPRPAQPFRRALPRPDRPVVCPGFGFDRFIRIRLFVRPKRRSGQLSSVRWWARGTDVSWANRTVDVPSGPAMHRPAPTRPWYVRVLDSAGSMHKFPGHALHEKGLQRQIGVVTLVSSQERRALAVPRMNRLSTARFVPPSVLSMN